MGYAHGHNDAQKTMGIIALTLFGAEASGALDDLPGWAAFLHPASSEQEIAVWIVVTCAVVMALGTASVAGRSSRPWATRWSNRERTSTRRNIRHYCATR